MQQKTTAKERLVGKFARGIQKLDEALKGLEEADLDLTREPAKWSIRQIVHHISEAEVLWNTALKAALANPGCTFDFNWYIADNKCADPLLYHLRPIDEALAIFRASRTQALDLINRIDNAWEQFLYPQHDNMGGKLKFTTEMIVQWQDKHLRLHILQIKQTRKAHGR